MSPSFHITPTRKGGRKIAFLAAVIFPALGAAVVGAAAELPPPAESSVDFSRDVVPILREKCFACHGPDIQQAGLGLDARFLLLRGGKSGPAFIEGNSAESLMIKRLAGSDLGVQMPPTGALPAEQIGILRRWIDDGAPWDVAVVTAKKREVSTAAAAVFAALREGDVDAALNAITKDPELKTARDEGGATALMYAALYGDDAAVKKVLDSGAYQNLANDASATALIWGVDNLKKTRLLVEAGADVNAQTSDGATAFLVAARRPGSSAVLRYLLDHGADAKTANKQGTSALHYAAASGDLDMVTLLLERGAAVNAQAQEGTAPLARAAVGGNFAMVALMLERGADPNLVGASFHSSLEAAVLRGDTRIVEALLKADADVNRVGYGDYTPLMWACYSWNANPGVIRILLDHGADPSRQGKDGNSALALAQRRGDQELVSLLTKYSFP